MKRKRSLSGDKAKQGLLKHQNSSMMENVRHRLETTPQIDVAGINNSPPAEEPIANITTLNGNVNGIGKPPQLQQTLLPHRRKTRKCCGREVQVSFLSLLMSTITTVMVLTMLAQLLTQILTSFTISDNLVHICNNTTQILLSELEANLYGALNRYGQILTLAVKNDLELVFFGQAQSQVSSFVNFIQASQVDAMTTRTGLDFFMRQGLSSFGDSMDLSLFGGVAAAAAGGKAVFYGASICDKAGTNSVAYCKSSSLELVNNGTVLRSCALLTPQLPNTCMETTSFSITAQTPYQEQRALDPSTPTARAIWSDVYVIDSSYYQVMLEDGARTQNSTGISLSYPVFPSGCNSYACMEGVAWATITSRALATYCLSVVESLDVGSDVVSNPFFNNTVLYIVNSTGALLAGSWSREVESNLIIPNQVVNAMDITSRETMGNRFVATRIRESAQFLTERFAGGFANTSLDSYTVAYFTRGTLDACVDFKSPNCSVVIAQSASPRSSASSFLSADHSGARMVLVFTLSVDNLLDFFATSEAQIAKTVAQQEDAQEQVLASIGIGAAIAVVAVICGVLISMIVAIKITTPLGKIEREMTKLVQFRFNEEDDSEQDRYYSRVLEVNKAEKMMEKLESSIEVFSKFVPSTVVKGIVQGKPQASQLHVAPRDVTVAFSDIKGFTTISEKLETLDLLFLLSRYLTVMTEVVELYEGTVTEILGDGLLVIWNAPDKCELHAAKAAACALAMQIAVTKLCVEFNPILRPHGLEDFSIRVGIHSGRVLAGNIGSKKKLKYGCLGDAVNTASRLEGLCKLYHVGIICSQDTFDQFPANKFQTRRLDLVQVKGKDNALALYEVQALKDMVGDEHYSLDTEQALGDESPAASPASTSFHAHSMLRRIPLLSSLALKENNGLKSRKSEASNLSFGPIPSLPSTPALLVPQLEINAIYEEALEAFQNADFVGAANLLANIQDVDVPSKLLAARVQLALSENVDPATWTGANRLTEKF